MQNVYIIGLGMIRFGKYPDKTVRQIIIEEKILPAEKIDALLG
jgi:hypothetical protein